jgi:hypothetical protein
MRDESRRDSRIVEGRARTPDERAEGGLIAPVH